MCGYNPWPFLSIFYFWVWDVVVTISKPRPLIPSPPWQIFRIHTLLSFYFPIPWLRSWAEADGLNGENISAFRLHSGSQTILDISQLLYIHLLLYKSQQNLASTLLAPKYENIATVKPENQFLVDCLQSIRSKTTSAVHLSSSNF